MPLFGAEKEFMHGGYPGQERRIRFLFPILTDPGTRCMTTV